MSTCDRCGKTLDDERAPVHVDYGETHITICYPCAIELTYLIGSWLATDALDDPHAWLKAITP